MNKQDWKGLQSQFAAAHASSGIKLEGWCEQQGLSYVVKANFLVQNFISNSCRRFNKNLNLAVVHDLP